jgi:diadenosine tetraphosphate (Ap4A) HIT family hydrolase
MTSSTCPFCDLVTGDGLLLDRGLAVGVADAFPLTPGHSLVIPRRHEADFFALTDSERSAMLDVAAELHALLKRQHNFDGVNLGLNNGAAAGQTVPHAHLHVIPRYTGDTPDPRGGVRWLFPDRAAYWSSPDRPA